MNRLMMWGMCAMVLCTAILNPQKVSAWSAADTHVSNTLFKSGLTNPQGIIVDSDGYVYVADVKIDKYDSSGTLVTSFGPSGPTDLAFDQSGNILVVDYNGDQVERWTKDGTLLNTYFSTGTGNSNLSFPWQIAVDSNWNVYVADFDNNRIQKFDSSMNYLATITGNGGAFSSPEGVAVDGSDNVYIMDSGNNRLQKFNSSGVFQWSITGSNGGFNYSEAIRADSSGNVYVADSGNDRVQIYDSSGNFVQQFGTSGSSLGQFSYPFGLGLTSAGVLYVTDSTRIQKYVYDRSSASISLTSLSGDTTTDTTPTITGTVTDALTALTAVEFSYDGGSYSSCTADDNAIDELSETVSCTPSTALSAGSHTISVRSTDSKTNTNTGGGIATYTFTVSTSPTPTPTGNVSGSSTSTSNSTEQSCTNPPTRYPTFTEGVWSGNSVTLRFTPVTGATAYMLMYGFFEGDDRFAANIGAENHDGTVSYTIGEIPQRTYVFRIRAMNGCAPGPWSGYVSLGPAVADVDDENNTESTPSGMFVSASSALITPTGVRKQNQNKTYEGDAGMTRNNAGRGIVQSLIPISATITTGGAVVGATGGVVMAVIAVVTVTQTLLSSLAMVYSQTKRSALLLPLDLANGYARWLFRSIPMVIGSVLSEPVIPSSSGVVFDTSTHEPLSGVFVLLVSESGNLATDFTDRKGNYKITPRPDIYTMKAQDSRYVYPSTKSPKDLQRFSHVYIPGQPITVREPDEVISHYSIPLDPVNSSPSLTSKIWSKTGMVRGAVACLLFVISGFATVTSGGSVHIATFGILGIYGGATLFRQALYSSVKQPEIS